MKEKRENYCCTTNTEQATSTDIAIGGMGETREMKGREIS